MIRSPFSTKIDALYWIENIQGGRHEAQACSTSAGSKHIVKYTSRMIALGHAVGVGRESVEEIMHLHESPDDRNTRRKCRCCPKWFDRK